MTARYYRDIVQGTTQWKSLRLGIPTASQFHRIVTPAGKASKSQEGYRHELLAERLLGEEIEGFESQWMTRGKETEAEAVAFYELQTGCDTEKVGFVTNDAGTVGASPDRLIGTIGLAEIKVCKPSTHIGYLLQDGSAYAEHRIQAQGQLWIAEDREWNDLLCYCPGLPHAIHRIYREEPFLKLLEKEMAQFVEDIERLWQVCVSKGWIAHDVAEERSGDPLLDALLKSAERMGMRA